MGINRATVTGNLTRDPELRQTAGGLSVLELGVAVNDRRRNQQTGEWEDRPNYIDCTVFGRRAEALAKMLYKGDKVAVDGRLRWSQWEAADGTKRSKVGIVADEVDLMQRRGGAKQDAEARAAVQAMGGAAEEVYDEDIPF